jgi:hypothetical protein
VTGNAGTEWDALETPLEVQPVFPVEAPGQKPEDKTRWPESYRQRSFVAWMRKNHPGIIVASIANEGRRSTFSGQRMKAQGLTPGMPDIVVLWDGGMAFVEFKGFAANGQAGKLSPAQIAACNKIHRNGHPVACFFRAESALKWLRSIGAPLVGWA